MTPSPPTRRRLKDLDAIDDGGIAKIAEACQAEVDAAIAFAKGSPEPAPESALENVFA